MMTLGRVVLALAAIATGVVDIIWKGFEPAHQPIQAFGDNLPGQQIFAYVIAVSLIVGGGAILRPQWIKFGAIVLAVVYAIFAIFWLPRLYTAPHALGWRIDVVISILAGICQQLIVVAAALLLFGRQRGVTAAQWIFGVSSIVFGLAHLLSISASTGLVPKWLPPNQSFWVALTGAAFVLAGIAILTKIRDVPAARLLALMLFIFSLLALLPVLFAYPHSQIAWGSNAYNLAAVASVVIFAASIAGELRGYVD